MNRLENILLTLATAAALFVASTANADTHTDDGLNGIPVVKTPDGTRMARDLELEKANADSGTRPEDGLPGVPMVKTPNGTRLARDLELEKANADSGTKPGDGLPGRPVVRTPNGTRVARDLEAEQNNRSKVPCPEEGRGGRTRDIDGSRTRAANQAGSLLPHSGGLPLDLNRTRSKDNELADRGAQMGSLADAAKRNKDRNAGDKIKSTKNTTLDKALKRAGIDPARLEGAKSETGQYGHTKVTLGDGTVIWTGSDSDELGTSVTSPNGDEVNVFPDGRVSTRKGLKGDTNTHHPNGTTTLYDPKQDTLTVVDKHGRTMTRPLDFFKDWYAKGWNADTVLDLLDPLPGGKDPGNTTFRDTLRRAGVGAEDLKNATKIETSKYDNSVKITLKDGTEIWTGPDSDGSGSSVTKPNGDQTEVFPNGAVSTRKGKDGKTITTRPDGITTTYDPKDQTLTVEDKNGNSETRNMKFWNDWFKAGNDAADLLRIYYPETGSD
jgi:hypothetical protein